MDDVHNPRVQTHAASAIITFCEHCKPDILTKYLQLLVSKLLTLVQNGRKIVQEQVVTAIASVADCVQKEFIPYYDSVVPYLKAILVQATGAEYRVLRGKAMECVSLISTCSPLLPIMNSSSLCNNWL